MPQKSKYASSIRIAACGAASQSAQIASETDCPLPWDCSDSKSARPASTVRSRPETPPAGTEDPPEYSISRTEAPASCGVETCTSRRTGSSSATSLAVFDKGVDQQLNGFVGAVGQREFVLGDVRKTRPVPAAPRRIRDKSRGGPAVRYCCSASITRGEQPTVFSLKSRRSFPSRPPDGGEYGAMPRTASRGVRACSASAIARLHGSRVRLQPFRARQRGDGGRQSASAPGSIPEPR